MMAKRTILSRVLVLVVLRRFNPKLSIYQDVSVNQYKANFEHFIRYMNRFS